MGGNALSSLFETRYRSISRPLKSEKPSRRPSRMDSHSTFVLRPRCFRGLTTSGTDERLRYGVRAYDHGTVYDYESDRKETPKVNEVSKTPFCLQRRVDLYRSVSAAGPLKLRNRALPIGAGHHRKGLSYLLSYSHR